MKDKTPRDHKCSLLVCGFKTEAQCDQAKAAYEAKP